MAVTQDQQVAPSHRGVVVGVNDGEAGDAALRFAASIAAPLSLPVVPMHVYRAGHGGPDTMLVGSGDLQLVARQTLDGAVERGREALATVPDVTPRLAHGQVARTLVGESQAADMLVVGRPRRGSRAALPECSVTVQVAVHARCPVTVVPVGWHLDPAAGALTVAIATAQFGLPILHEAFSIARALGVGVRVVHVPSPSRGGRPPGRSTVTRAGRSAPGRDGAGYPLEQAVGQATRLFAGVRADIETVEGAPGSALERLSHGTALLVAGRHERPRRRRRSGLGTVARHVLRTSACPVVFVDPGDRWPVPVPGAGSANLAGAPTGE